MREYYVYMMASVTGTLYTGVTGDLETRVFQHRTGVGSAFTSRYGCNKLVYFESTSDVHAAIAREKQIKGWTRTKKSALIQSVNPTWKDLAAGWTADPSAAAAASE